MTLILIVLGSGTLAGLLLALYIASERASDAPDKIERQRTADIVPLQRRVIHKRGVSR